MASEFSIVRRVEFADTDMAGIMHFSNFFRFMETAEHGFFRSLGFSIMTKLPDGEFGWPRVHVSCDYRRPLYFEDEVEVRLRVREKTERALSYDFTFFKVGDEASGPTAQGRITAVCVTVDGETGRMRSTPIPAQVADKIEVAASTQEVTP